MNDWEEAVRGPGEVAKGQSWPCHSPSLFLIGGEAVLNLIQEWEDGVKKMLPPAGKWPKTYTISRALSHQVQIETLLTVPLLLVSQALHPQLLRLLTTRPCKLTPPSTS